MLNQVGKYPDNFSQCTYFYARATMNGIMTITSRLGIANLDHMISFSNVSLFWDGSRGGVAPCSYTLFIGSTTSIPRALLLCGSRAQRVSTTATALLFFLLLLNSARREGWTVVVFTPRLQSCGKAGLQLNPALINWWAQSSMLLQVPTLTVSSVLTMHVWHNQSENLALFLDLLLSLSMLNTASLSTELARSYTEQNQYSNFFLMFLDINSFISQLV